MPTAQFLVDVVFLLFALACCVAIYIMLLA